MRSRAVWSIFFSGTILVVSACATRNAPSSHRQGSASASQKGGGRSLQLEGCTGIDENSPAGDECVENPPPPGPSPAPPPPEDPNGPAVAPPPAPLVTLDGVSICKGTVSPTSSFSPWNITDLGNGKVRCQRNLQCDYVAFAPSETSNLVCAPELATACSALPQESKTLDVWSYDEPSPNGRSCDQIWVDTMRGWFRQSIYYDTPEKVEARIAMMTTPVSACTELSSSPAVLVRASCSQRIPESTNQSVSMVAALCPTGQTMGSPTEVPMCRLNWSNSATTAGWGYVAEFGLNQGNNVDYVCQYRHACDGYGSLSTQTMPQSEDFDSQGNQTRICSTLGGDDCSIQDASMKASLASMQAIINVLPSFRWNGVPPNQSELSRADFRTYVDQTCAAAVAAQRASLDATAASDCRAKADTIVSQGPKTLLSCCQAGGAAP